MSIIGQVRVYSIKSKPNHLRLYFQQSAVDVLGSYVIIDLEKKKIRRPTIDDDKTQKIKHLFTSATVSEEDFVRFVGHYDIHQRDEDTFKLKKVKDGLPKSSRLGKGK